MSTESKINTDSGAADPGPNSGPDRIASAEGVADPIRPVRLPDGHVACLGCGVPVPAPDDPGAVTWAEAIDRAGNRLPTPDRIPPEPMIRCVDCQRIADLAAELLRRHPPVRDRIGPGAASHRVESALSALSAVGGSMPDPSACGVGELGMLLRHLTEPGAAARWISRFAPLAARDAVTGTGNPAGHPWAHVDGEQRSDLRSAYAAYLSERLARMMPERRLAPPQIPADYLRPSRPVFAVTGGCLFCGVGTVAVPAATCAALGEEQAARRVWTLRRPGSPEALGGRRSPSAVVGWTCPACSRAADAAGAVGPSAMDYALVQHLGGAGGWDPGVDGLTKLVGWGAVVIDAQCSGAAPIPPNETPWEHLPRPQLDRLARSLGVADKADTPYAQARRDARLRKVAALTERVAAAADRRRPPARRPGLRSGIPAAGAVE